MENAETVTRVDGATQTGKETSLPDASWEGTFNARAYEAARTVLEQDRERVRAEMKGVATRRARIVGTVAAVWVACSVALAVVNPNLLLVAELGWVLIVAWAVFYLYPMIAGRGNLEDVFDQYAEQLNRLEAAEIALPTPADMGDLVAALDLVSLPDQTPSDEVR